MADVPTYREEFAIYRRLVGARVRSELQYRTSFAAFLVAQAVVTFLDCVAILAIFSAVPSLGGWSRTQVLWLYGTSVASFGLTDLAAAPVEYIARYVRSGDFDGLLTRPVSVLTQLLGHEFALRRAGRCLQSAVVLTALLLGGVTDWTWTRAAVAAWGVLGAALAFAGLFLLTSSFAFWSPRSEEVANAFTYGGEYTAQYPTHVFGDWVRGFAFGVVPSGASVYLPAIYVLDAPNPLDVPVWLQIAAPAIFVPIIGAAALAWRAGIGHYESTGS